MTCVCPCHQASDPENYHQHKGAAGCGCAGKGVAPQKTIRIMQITAVVENRQIYDAGVEANTEATVYGLGLDNKMYYWGVLKTYEVKLDEPDEEGNKSYRERVMGWCEAKY